MSEEKAGAAVDRDSSETKQTKEELLAALQQDFATSVNKVYVNSLDREYQFSEITVQDQKSLTRMMQANQNRKDIVYDAQCALINKAALDKTFDVYKTTDFDRTKLMIALYQANMFENKAKFTCQECGAENAYQIDYAETIHKLDEYKIEDRTFEYDNQHFHYKFSLQYPSVKLVSRFHAMYCRKHGVNTPKRMAKAEDTMTNLEYVNLFIVKAEITCKANNTKRVVDFNDYQVSDREDILAAFPQDVLYTEGGVLKYIVKQYIQPLNDCFEKHECLKCGAIYEKEGTDQVANFF